MQLLLFTIELVLLVAAVVDVLWTTLWVDGGAGPISSRHMEYIWQALRRVSGGRSGVLTLAGPLLVVATFVVWIGLLWLGWTLIFAGGQNALVDTYQTQDPIGWFDLLYFTAYSIFTLGIGDIIPRDGGWQIATIFTTASGMLIVTLGVSYVVSILGAVSRKRALASSITALGMDSETFVRKGWNGDDFTGFEFTLDSLSQDVDYLSYQYQAYPILHYYHTGKNAHSSALAVAVFDEALTLLRFGVAEEATVNSALLENAHSSTRNYVGTMSAGFIGSGDRVPPSPDLDRLREVGIPTVSDEEFEEELADHEEHRQRLLSLVEHDVREWPSRERERNPLPDEDE